MRNMVMCILNLDSVGCDMPGDAKVKKDLGKNIRRLAKKYPGKPKKQIVAIAYSEKRKSK